MVGVELDGLLMGEFHSALDMLGGEPVLYEKDPGCAVDRPMPPGFAVYTTLTPRPSPLLGPFLGPHVGERAILVAVRTETGAGCDAAPCFFCDDGRGLDHMYEVHAPQIEAVFETRADAAEYFDDGTRARSLEWCDLPDNVTTAYWQHIFGPRPSGSFPHADTDAERAVAGPARRPGSGAPL